MGFLLGLLSYIPASGAVWGAIGGGVTWFLNCKRCLIAAAIGAAFIAGNLDGRHRANANCREAQAQAEAAAAKRDAEVANAAAALVKKRLAEELALNADLQAKVDDYAASVKNLSASVRSCRAATANDSRRLRDIAK